MISKERLEELIKQGATIYYADRDVKFPIPIFLNEEDFVREKGLSHEESCVRDNILLEDLYEAEKQAEWHLKYHATRTEELTLPTWEDIGDEIELEFSCFNKSIGRIWVSKYADAISVTVGDEEWQKFYSEFTKENYIKACDLCLKLFEGEETC